MIKKFLGFVKKNSIIKIDIVRFLIIVILALIIYAIVDQVFINITGNDIETHIRNAVDGIFAFFRTGT